MDNEEQFEYSETEALSEEFDEKTLKKLRKAELKRLVMSDLRQNADGSLSSGRGLILTPYGFGDGAMNVMIFGIKDRKFRYRSTLKNQTQNYYQISKAMQKTGHIVSMDTAPDAAVCYVRHIVLRPVVLFYENDSETDINNVVIHAYCGRLPLAFLAVRQAVKRFEKELPKQIKRAASKEHS